MDEARLSRLKQRATHLVAIRESPSWPILRDILEQRNQKDIRRFVGEPVVDAQQLDYGRGFIRGVQYVIDIVERGEQELNKANKAAQALTEARE